MRVLVAMDEFDSILSSYHANRFVEEAIKSQFNEADIVQVPLFNGQREVIDSVLLWQSGTKYSVDHHDAYMKPKTSAYAVTENNITVVEAGNILSSDESEINPLNTSSYGLGEVLLEVLKENNQEILISVGNVASYDGGLGMLQALGAKFFDAEGALVDVSQGAKWIKYVRMIDLDDLDKRLLDKNIKVITDFESKYYGKNSRVMKEKELNQINQEDAVSVDNALWYISELFKSQHKLLLNKEDRGGAGSGIAALFNGLWKAQLLTGGDVVNELTYLDKLIEQADLVVFGEGLKPNQQLLETTSVRIAELSQKHQKINIAVCATDEKFDQYIDHDVTAMFKVFNKGQDTMSDLEMGIALRHLTTQALRLLKTSL
ncbi:glycerate kinase [Mammaliicoccus sp. Dog046]|uniref:glycerate kinase n=1 Tax=Mammaliicoccus sp. Dog046 TaxID=3034233 RepID=UPI002B25F2B3|nr:glycerate kinase [Mammaliicoccus sp. Dog046]WQK85014.1 glycerate kinase [Mammaliicoccus sp. Dog046]